LRLVRLRNSSSDTFVWHGAISSVEYSILPYRSPQGERYGEH
jgi:hypothetical protein